jgi:hypothetical protein
MYLMFRAKVYHSSLASETCAEHANLPPTHQQIQDITNQTYIKERKTTQSKRVN